MARIPNNELDRLKREVALVAWWNRPACTCDDELAQYLTADP